jgi:hypothetical protein
MTWFEIGDRVTWKDHNGYNKVGEVISVLMPGETAESVLDENERTKISTRNLRAERIPQTTRALMRVLDEEGRITYHTKRLGQLTKMEEEVITMSDVMTEIRELKKDIKEVIYKNQITRLRTVGK